MSELKYFKKAPTQLGYGEIGFVFGNIFSIREENEILLIVEECDGYHSEGMSPESAIEMFEEAIRIIKEKEKP